MGSVHPACNGAESVGGARLAVTRAVAGKNRRKDSLSSVDSDSVTGEVTHKEQSYPGEHPAIVEKPLWEEVQTGLAANLVNRATGVRTDPPSLLTGMAF